MISSFGGAWSLDEPRKLYIVRLIAMVLIRAAE